MQEWRKKLIDAGFQEIVFEDAMELLLEMVRQGGPAGGESEGVRK